MSARALAACSFEPAAEPTAATDHPVPEGIVAEIRFREDLWREYRIEAINAGFNTVQATEYASVLSPEVGLAVGVSEMAPVGRGWFYQSRARMVRRTITSGLITLTRWEKSKSIRRTVAGAPRCSPLVSVHGTREEKVEGVSPEGAAKPAAGANLPESCRAGPRTSLLGLVVRIPARSIRSA
jgi:hypothetical protein